MAGQLGGRLKLDNRGVVDDLLGDRGGAGRGRDGQIVGRGVTTWVKGVVLVAHRRLGVIANLDVPPAALVVVDPLVAGAVPLRVSHRRLGACGAGPELAGIEQVGVGVPAPGQLLVGLLGGLDSFLLGGGKSAVDRLTMPGVNPLMLAAAALRHDAFAGDDRVAVLDRRGDVRGEDVEPVTLSHAVGQVAVLGFAPGGLLAGPDQARVVWVDG